MTLDEFCDQWECTPPERKMVYRYFLVLRFTALVKLVEAM